MALDNNTGRNWIDKTTIKNFFKRGLKPTQEQFWSTWDSFWHKDEKLPISSIDKLGDLLDGKAEENHEHSQYAKNDATSLTDADIISWQQALGVDDLDYVEIPTETATENSHPYVVVIDDAGKSAKRNSTDFGKKYKVMNIEPDGNDNFDFSGVPMNWTNSSHRFSGLVDKSADATFNQFALFDRNGYLAKATQIANAFESGLINTTAEQGLRIGHLLNGGIGSSGMMSVNMISPPYIKLANEDTYVVLRGANLYLQVDNHRIDITNMNGDILANIPNSNIQLRASGTELVFFYNFSTLGQGTYKLRLISGSKILQTTLSFEVVQNMEIVNLSATTWEVLEKNNNQNTASVISPTAITLNRLVNDTTTYLPTISAKSSPIFQAHENWMLEFEVTFRMNLGSGMQSLSKTVAGIDYQSVQHTLIQSGIAYVYWYKVGSAGHISTAQYLASPNTYIGSTDGYGSSGSSHDHIKTLNVIMVKTGNMITVNSDGQTSTNVVTNGEAYCFLAQISGRQSTNSESMSIKLLTAYKF